MLFTNSTENFWVFSQSFMILYQWETTYFSRRIISFMFNIAGWLKTSVSEYQWQSRATSLDASIFRTWYPYIPDSRTILRKDTDWWGLEQIVLRRIDNEFCTREIGNNAGAYPWFIVWRYLSDIWIHEWCYFECEMKVTLCNPYSYSSNKTD